jgi:hypothetical protein
VNTGPGKESFTKYWAWQREFWLILALAKRVLVNTGLAKRVLVNTGPDKEFR